MSSPLKKKVKRPVCHKCTKLTGRKVYLVKKEGIGIICPHCARVYATQEQLNNQLSRQRIAKFVERRKAMEEKK